MGHDIQHAVPEEGPLRAAEAEAMISTRYGAAEAASSESADRAPATAAAGADAAAAARCLVVHMRFFA